MPKRGRWIVTKFVMQHGGRWISLSGFYRVMHVVLARYCYRMSSVRPSVTLLYRGHIGWTSSTLITRAILRHMFTVTNCHGLIICYLFTAVCFFTRVTMACDQRRSAGSGVAKSDPQNIGIHGKTADLSWTLYRRNLNK